MITPAEHYLCFIHSNPPHCVMSYLKIHDKTLFVLKIEFNQDHDKDKKQAGAELGQAQPSLS